MCIRDRSLTGTADQAVSLLTSQCREALEKGAPIADVLGERETSLIANVVNSKDAKPVLLSPGKWRILQVNSVDDSQPGIPIVVGVRDDVKSDESTPVSTRVAVWGLAMPRFTDEPDNAIESVTENDASGDKAASANSETANNADKTDDQPTEWTTFVATPTPENASSEFKAEIIPSEFDRTLAIANPNGGAMIGMVGDSEHQAMRFYDSLALKKQWKVSSPWEQNQNTWTAQFKLPKDSPFKGIQVQLHVNHNEGVRGMLMLQPK